jgi:flagellar basal-body rod protein FlgG
MIRSLYTAASGMKANQMFVDNISNNLANVSVSGFKKSRMEFEDLIYQTVKPAGGESAEGVQQPVGIQIGLGTRSVTASKIFTQGSLEMTGNPHDLAIEGDGFFQVKMADGSIAYTRTGSFKVNSEGAIVNSAGQYLEPPITVPLGIQGDIKIDTSGKVFVSMTLDQEMEQIGQLELARFVNNQGLSSLGGNLYSETSASGRPTIGFPGEENIGTVRAQFLEMSNVQMVEEMVSMIVAQRAYEVSSKAITASDDMLQTANQLKR